MKDNKIEELLEERNSLALKYFNTSGDPHILLLLLIGLCILTGGIGHYIGSHVYHIARQDLLPWLMSGPIICCVVVLILVIISSKTDHDTNTQKFLDKMLCSKFYERHQIKKQFQDTQQKILKMVKQQISEGEYEYLTVLIYDKVFHYSNLKDIQIRPSDQEIADGLQSLVQEYHLNENESFACLSDKLYVEFYSNKKIIETAGLSKVPLLDAIGENGYNHYSQDLINQIIANSENIQSIFILHKTK